MATWPANAPVCARPVQVASFAKPDTESKFTEDTGTKHDAASVAVQEAAQKLLYPDFYKLRSMSTWTTVQSQ